MTSLSWQTSFQNRQCHAHSTLGKISKFWLGLMTNLFTNPCGSETPWDKVAQGWNYLSWQSSQMVKLPERRSTWGWALGHGFIPIGSQATSCTGYASVSTPVLAEMLEAKVSWLLCPQQTSLQNRQCHALCHLVKQANVDLVSQPICLLWHSRVLMVHIFQKKYRYFLFIRHTE